MNSESTTGCVAAPSPRAPVAEQDATLVTEPARDVCELCDADVTGVRDLHNCYEPPREPARKPDPVKEALDALARVPDDRVHAVATVAQHRQRKLAAQEPSTMPAELAQPEEPWGTLASQVKPEKIDWLWNNMLPRGQAVILQGIGGIGKGLLTMDWASRVTTGAAFPGGEPRPPRNVLVFSDEDDPKKVLVPRLIAAGANMDRVILGDLGKALSLPRDAETLGEFCLKRDVALVIIDPVNNYMRGIDFNSEADVRPALMELTRAMRQADACAVIVRHFNKGSGLAHQRGGGSVAYRSTVRGELNVTVDQKVPGRLAITSSKNNYGNKLTQLFRLEDRRVEVDGESVPQKGIGYGDLDGRDADEMLGAKPTQTKREQAQNFLSGLLERGPVLKRDAVAKGEGLGISEKTLEKAARKLNVQSSTVRGKFTFWLGANAIIDKKGLETMLPPSERGEPVEGVRS